MIFGPTTDLFVFHTSKNSTIYDNNEEYLKNFTKSVPTKRNSVYFEVNKRRLDDESCNIYVSSLRTKRKKRKRIVPAKNKVKKEKKKWQSVKKSRQCKCTAPRAVHASESNDKSCISACESVRNC